MTGSATPDGLRGCDRPLVDVYDVALLDLDGVVYVGPDPAPGAVRAIKAIRDKGMRCAFVTNNASRTPDSVAAHLAELGVPAMPDDIVTAAQAAAHLLADRLPVGAKVLVVGGEGLQVAVREAGLEPVTTAADDPAAVVQGYSVDIGYAQLAEAALAVQAGIPWIATNADTTIPTPRGLLPGNGALVAAVAAATGKQPEFAGKPERPLHEEAVRRTGATRPLVVGDRLDTDIEGAVRGGADSLLVLTGVADAAALLAAPAGSRPSYLAEDLNGVLRAHPAPTRVRSGWRCGGWHACVTEGGRLLIEPIDDQDGGDQLDPLRVLCAAGWDAEAPVDGIDGPEDLLQRLGLK